jgi:FMN phosphatase YigB (HAD superfamily)
MIKALIFDLGRVIVPFDFLHAYHRVERLTGIPPAEIRARIAASGLVERFDCGQIAPRDFAAALCSHIDLDISYEDFRAIWNSIFLPETLFPDAFFAALAPAWRLVLLSNTNVLHFEAIRENYPLLRHFHSFVLSYEVGAMKPAPAMYRRAVEEAGCLPGECFFTDDIAAYVEAAQGKGIDAIQFHSAERTENELRARGVEWSV